MATKRNRQRHQREYVPTGYKRDPKDRMELQLRSQKVNKERERLAEILPLMHYRPVLVD